MRRLVIRLPTGSYFASKRCEFEVERPSYRVVGDRDLNLSNSVAKGSVSPNFIYASEASAQSIPIEIDSSVELDDDSPRNTSQTIINSYVNGGN